MYKTDFIVKYNTIENELLQLLDKREETPLEEDDDYKYTKTDISYICDKLYRDELISVFDAESLEDPKMDTGMQLLFERLLKYDMFNLFLLDVGKQFMDKSNAKTEEELLHLKRNSDYLIFITMFSQQVFYMTHQWICNLLLNDTFGSELMDEIKAKILTVILYS
uniref:Uncharacterized protein n=1 Tax=viral metagenome TaxID=1070528 RepID=A0A6C0I8F9_9ZZZZ